MQTAQAGDRVRVHYVKRFQDGSVASSRVRGPLEVIIGTDHPRLPGLGLALVGLTPGGRVTVQVPSEPANPPADTTRVRRWPRTRFASDAALPVGQWVRIVDRQGKRRWVRILEVDAKAVVVDTSYRGAGQALELDVELIGIEAPAAPKSRRP